MKKVTHFFRVVFGVFCILIALGGIVATIQERQPAMLILVAVFSVLAFLLFRKKKESIPSPTTSVEPVVTVSNQSITVPVEVLEPVDAYIKADGVVYRTDGQPISDREVPYLIETGLREAVCREQNNPFRRSDADKELIFKFTQTHGQQSEMLTSQFEALANEAYKTDSLDEKVALLTAALQKFQIAKEWHYKISKGGMMYFQDMWERMHNSGSACFSWEDIEKGHLSAVLLERDYIRPLILKHAAEGFLQKDIYDYLPDAEKSDVQRVLREMEKEGQLIRTKKGASYFVERI